jgi:hypothetical protein
MYLNRKKKIEILKAIHRGEKDISALSNKITVTMWGEIESQPGLFKEEISGRIASLPELKKEYAAELKKGRRFIWVNKEMELLVTGKNSI